MAALEAMVLKQLDIGSGGRNYGRTSGAGGAALSIDDGRRQTSNPDAAVQGSPRTPEVQSGLWSRLKSLISPSREATALAPGKVRRGHQTA